MKTLAYLYRIFGNNQHGILCLGDVVCAIMTMANGTYYLFNPHSHGVIGFQDDKGDAVLLYFQAKEKLLAHLDMLEAQLGAMQFEVTPYKIQNDLTFKQLTTGPCIDMVST